MIVFSTFAQVLAKIDQFLGDLFGFNKSLVAFDETLNTMDSWINGKAQVLHRGLKSL